MNTKNRLLPYPVLGNYDAVYPLLDDEAVVMPDPIMDEKSFHFHIELNQNNHDITKLIDENNAEYLCEVYCKSTFLRQRYTSSKPMFDFFIERKDVSGHVDFEFYVVLKENLRYTNIGFHEDYRDLTFELEKGNILVVFPSASFNAKLVNYKMYAIGSFMKFLDSDVQEIDIDMNRDDAIYILLPHNMYKQYNETIQANQDFNDIIISSILYSSLAQAIMRYNEDRDNEKTWADALRARVDDINTSMNKNLKLNASDAFEIANLILKKPYERLFESLIRINEKAKII